MMISVALAQHQPHGGAEAGVAVEDARELGGGARRRQHRGEARAALGRVALERHRIEPQEIEGVAVEDELEAAVVGARVVAQPAAEASEVVVVEEGLELVVPTRLAVLAAADVQVADDHDVVQPHGFALLSHRPPRPVAATPPAR
ncbi:MAG: hypothetical protein IPN32_11130 [Deltaproteobacteria bacterium]|nr:hypothetical protein [Deltaproteobacteria bacterium]